jgi:membrane-associated phospholipid phosphatase
MSFITLARFISVIGHPFVLMPAAVYASALVRPVPAPARWAAWLATLWVALALALFSRARVRAGRWGDLDASTPAARRQLNGVALALLWGTGVVLHWLDQPLPVLAGPALGGVLVLLALGLGRWQHMSLHAAFAVFSAALLWSHPLLLGSALGLAAAVMVSRVVLARHTPFEVATGALAGALVGAAFHAVPGQAALTV